MVSGAQDATSFEQSVSFATALSQNQPTQPTANYVLRFDHPVTWLDFALNRHSDPHQGRFTQVDPIGMDSVESDNPQTLNLYAYCANDPVNSIDPSGLGFFSFFKKIFKGIWKVLTSKWFVIALTVALAAIPLAQLPLDGL